jgi:hypothetical protein
MTKIDALLDRGTQELGRRAAFRTAILTGVTAAVALGRRPAFASGSPYVVTDPLTNNTPLSRNAGSLPADPFGSHRNDCHAAPAGPG